MLEMNCRSSRSQIFSATFLSHSVKHVLKQVDQFLNESDDKERIYHYGNLKALQLLVENELQTDLDHLIMFLGQPM